MTQSDFTYVYEKGRIRGVKFQIGARHDPNTNNVESFAVILFFELQDGTRVEVAKIDNSEHEGKDDIHLDRYYCESDSNVKKFDIDIDDCWEAEHYLEQNWERFATTYLQNHGKNPRNS